MHNDRTEITIHEYIFPTHAVCQQCTTHNSLYERLELKLFNEAMRAQYIGNPEPLQEYFRHGGRPHTEGKEALIKQLNLNTFQVKCETCLTWYDVHPLKCKTKKVFLPSFCICAACGYDFDFRTKKDYATLGALTFPRISVAICPGCQRFVLLPPHGVVRQWIFEFYIEHKAFFDKLSHGSLISIFRRGNSAR